MRTWTLTTQDAEGRTNTFAGLTEEQLHSLLETARTHHEAGTLTAFAATSQEAE